MLAQITYEQLLERLKGDLVPLMTNNVQLPKAAMNAFVAPSWVSLAVWGFVAVIIFVALWNSFFTVRTQRFVVVERLGKFRRVAKAGLHLKLPIFDKAHTPWSLAVYENVVEVETITVDKVSVVLEVPVQYQILEGKEELAFYRLNDVSKRIESLVFDEVRSRVPKLNLDQLFNSKDEVATSVMTDLKADLNQFGYDINRVMITDIEPEAKVKAAMNDINASQKEGEAALARAQNEQRVQVAQAEGRLRAATLNKDAEIIDAEAVAKSVEIIGRSLHDNQGYLRWQWIHMMKENKNSTIYVPTEAGLPILEAGKR